MLPRGYRVGILILQILGQVGTRNTSGEMKTQALVRYLKIRATRVAEGSVPPCTKIKRNELLSSSNTIYLPNFEPVRSYSLTFYTFTLSDLPLLILITRLLPKWQNSNPLIDPESHIRLK